MSAHTPGPWQYKPNSGQIIAPMVVYLADDGACGDNDCCGQPTYWVEIRPEDGRLIAAAPELLNMLIKLRDAGSWYSSALEIDVYGKGRLDGEELEAELKSLIDKATGAAA